MSDWVSLFSGGKDSSWALYCALQQDLDVSRLLTIHPAGDSYMYHTPATELAGLAAESIGIDLVEVAPDDFGADDVEDASAQGDAELEPMEAALRELAADADLDLDGVTAGAVESEFQTNRIQAMCDRLDIDLFAFLLTEDVVQVERFVRAHQVEKEPVVGHVTESIDEFVTGDRRHWVDRHGWVT